jgi:hypothetical protein
LSSGKRLHLEREVGLEDFLDGLADLELVQRLEVGEPSRNRMRSASVSACFISSIDSWRSYSASFSMPQFLSTR